MKAIFVVLLFALAGCNLFKERVVYVQVYEPIKIEMPVRPILSSTEVKTFNEIGKNAETDLIELKSYALQVESLLEGVRAKQGQPVKINK